MMSSCCTLRLKRRRAFSRDSPSCSRISAKQTHPQTRPEGPSSYYKELTGSQVGRVKKVAGWAVHKVKGTSLTTESTGFTERIRGSWQTLASRGSRFAPHSALFSITEFRLSSV